MLTVGLLVVLFFTPSLLRGVDVPIPTLPEVVFIPNCQPSPVLPHRPTKLSVAIPAKATSAVFATFVNQVPAVAPPGPACNRMRPATSSLYAGVSVPIPTKLLPAFTVKASLLILQLYKLKL